MGKVVVDILELSQENLEKAILKDMGDEFAKHVDEEMEIGRAHV